MKYIKLFEDWCNEKKSPYKPETLSKYKKEYNQGKKIPFGVKTSLIAQGKIPHEGGEDRGKKKKTAVYENAGLINKTIGINQIGYGNQPQELLKYSQDVDSIKSWFIENGYIEKIKNSCPTNDSEITIQELEQVYNKTCNITEDELAFAKHVNTEENLPLVFIELLKKHGYDISVEQFNSIDYQTASLLFYLKDVINRPRPWQLARYYNIPITPIIRSNAMSSSYPGGHALTGFAMAEYYSRKYPEARVELEKLGERIADSRESVGLHYPSDTEIAREICDIIFKNNLIKEVQ